MWKLALNHRSFVFIVALLTACGGGGGDSGTQSNQQTGGGSESGSVGTSSHASEIAAIRFLEQASFGATTESIRKVQAIGFQHYLDEQISLNVSTFRQPGPNDRGPQISQDSFFYNALNNEDQLRQRMAYALGQIFVVSSNGVFDSHAIHSYQQFLSDNAFNNYYQILEGVTLHPTMGRFLDMANNSAQDTPNENYAREVMQLFSMGMVRLNIDGTSILESNGLPSASYDQADVTELARALTGWTYPTQPGEATRLRNPPYYYGQMQPSPSLHDYGEKTFLGEYIPAGQSVLQDLKSVLSIIFHHPNVAPFVSHRLIQHFVTSNPTPSYVARVAAVFNNNGSGIRGDLKAVIKAILLDPEARHNDDLNSMQTTGSRLKEPALFIISFLRTLDARSDGISLDQYSDKMGQDMYSAPTVFNYYPPDHVIGDEHMFGPEFKIHTGPEIIERYNFVNDILYGKGPAGTVVNLSAWINTAGDTKSLIDKLNKRFMHNQMSHEMKTILTNTIESQPKDKSVRAKAALYLVTTSSQYSIHH